MKSEKIHKCNVCGKHYKNSGLYYENHIRKCHLKITNQYDNLIEAYEKDLNECNKIVYRKLSFVDTLLDLGELDLRCINNLTSHLLRFHYFNRKYSHVLTSYKYIPYLKIIKK